MNPRRILAFIMLGTVSLGCSQEAEEPDAPAVPEAVSGSLTLGLQQEPGVLNNILQLTLPGQTINNCIFSRFVTYNENLELVPDLITEIPSTANGGISADHLTYTYHLRPEARWHDGTPLTSADVLFTYEIIMDPEAGAESTEGWDIISSVDTPDAHTVVFHLRETYSNFVGDTFLDEDVLPKHLLENERGSAFSAAEFHRQPLGSGPFRFVEWVSGSHVRLEANTDYYGQGPHLQELIFKFVPESNALALQLRSGELDAWVDADVTQLSALEQVPNITVHRTQSTNYSHVTFNCKNDILTDPRVRRALALATDRQAIARYVYDGLARPALSGRYPTTPWYWPGSVDHSKYDLEAAARLLAEAGWQQDDSGIRQRQGVPLQLTISTGSGRPLRERLQVVLQDQWRKVGVDLKIQNYEMRTLIGKLIDGDFDVALFGWGASPDPDGIRDVYGTEAAQNFGGYSNPSFDDLVDLAARTFDHQERIEIFHSVEEILLQDTPAIPLVWLVKLSPMTDALQNFKPNPSNVGDTWNVADWWLKR